MARDIRSLSFSVRGTSSGGGAGGVGESASYSLVILSNLFKLSKP